MWFAHWFGIFIVLVAGVVAREGDDQEVVCSIPGESEGGVCVERSDCVANVGTSCGGNRICCRRSQQSGRRRRSVENDECGLPLYFSGRIIDGSIVNIDEFPWAALLLYKRNIPRCGGVLISRNYVVSAAHCLTGSGYSQHGPLKYVRLREYDLQNDVDCMIFEDGMDCSDEKIDIPPERIIIHPNYEVDNIHQYHDIGLIEIQLTVPYSDFLRPICLPVDEKSAGQQEKRMLIVTGWGRTDFFKPEHGEISSPIKMKVSLPFVTHASCSEAFRLQKLQLIPGQICAGGRRGDSCAGDSGSPLMFFDRLSGFWRLSGIVSQGPYACGSNDKPGIYTNVVKYLPWIKEITGLYE